METKLFKLLIIDKCGHIIQRLMYNFITLLIFLKNYLVSLNKNPG